MSFLDDPTVMQYAWLYAWAVILGVPAFGIVVWRVAAPMIPQKVERAMLAIWFGASFAGVTAAVRGWL